jgi:hypothetical protein
MAFLAVYWRQIGSDMAGIASLGLVYISVTA